MYAHILHLAVLDVVVWDCSDSLYLPWASCQIRKIAGAHAPGMPGTFSPSLQVSDPDMHHGTYVTHVPWCMPGSLHSGLLWSRWPGKRFRHSRRMRNPQFCIFGKRPMVTIRAILKNFNDLITGVLKTDDLTSTGHMFINSPTFKSPITNHAALIWK